MNAAVEIASAYAVCTAEEVLSYHDQLEEAVASNEAFDGPCRVIRVADGEWMTPEKTTRPKAAHNAEEVMPHASKPTRPRAVKSAPAPATAVPEHVQDLAGAREEEDLRNGVDFVLPPPEHEVAQDVGELPPAAASLDDEPRPDAGEPKRFRVIARDRTSLGEYVGIEDALRANRTNRSSWQVVRISDGVPMTVPFNHRPEDDS